MITITNLVDALDKEEKKYVSMMGLYRTVKDLGKDVDGKKMIKTKLGNLIVSEVPIVKTHIPLDTTRCVWFLNAGKWSVISDGLKIEL